jgi:hypothetical protein
MDRTTSPVCETFLSVAKGGGGCYLLTGGGMLKRVADWLEKMSAGSMLIGLYQGDNYATIFGFCLIVTALFLEWRMKK